MPDELLYLSVLYLMVALFSLAVGSLLNVIIHRLPLMIEAEWRAECADLLNFKAKETIEDASTKNFNLFFPRSHCPHCKRLIPIWHNIPLLSYLILRGRCQKCREPISWRYPFVEALSMGLSLFATWHFGFNMTLIFVLLFIWILIAICFIDLDHQLLPDNLSLSLLWLGLIANTQTLFTTLPNAVLSAVGAYLSLWLFIKLFYLLTGKIGMGHGDFKLFAAFGAWFGWLQLPLILLISSITGAIAGLLYLRMAGKTRDTPIPYGPFLCLAGLIALFYGNSIIQWYLGFYQFQPNPGILGY